jgi:hypothetical protein
MKNPTPTWLRFCNEFTALAAIGVLGTGLLHGAGIWAGVVCLIGAGLLLRAEYFRSAAVLMMVGGIVALPVGIVTIVLAPFAWRRGNATTDRSAERTCMRCGYDMRGLPVPRCPECGCLYGFTEPMENLGITEEELRRKDGGPEDAPAG